MGAISSLASTVLSARQNAREVQAIDTRNQQLAAQAANEKQKNLLALQEKETTRVAKLKAALATQRADYGGSGVGSGAGSSEAVLSGISATSDIEGQQNRAATTLSNKSVDENLSYQTNLNLLQRQQLKQKAALNYLTNLF